MHAKQPRDLRRRQGGGPILRLVDVERLGHARIIGQAAGIRLAACHDSPADSG